MPSCDCHSHKHAIQWPFSPQRGLKRSMCSTVPPLTHKLCLFTISKVLTNTHVILKRNCILQSPPSIISGPVIFFCLCMCVCCVNNIYQLCVMFKGQAFPREGRHFVHLFIYKPLFYFLKSFGQFHLTNFCEVVCLGISVQVFCHSFVVSCVLHHGRLAF